ncbi:MAG: FUSC family protein, partial [Bryobacteraceae bacterium]
MSPLAAFWHAVTTFDRSKFNSTRMGLRHALATALPLAVGIAIGKPLAGIAISVGALNVSFSDGRDPYAQRARRMLTWSCLGAFAVFTGSVSGETGWAAVLVAAIWAFIAGMALSVSTRAGDLGLNTLVILIVFGARGALSPTGALIAALLALAGGLLQTGFALLSWTIHNHEPEREALGRVYAGLAGDLDPHSGKLATMPLAATTSAQVQETISALGRDHSLEGERDRLLFNQADRIRMSVYVLGTLKAELQRSVASDTGLLASADRMLAIASRIASEIASCLTSGQGNESALISEMQPLLETAHSATPLAEETIAAMDTLAGQLRVAFELATHTTTEGLEKFAHEEASLPWRLQMRGWIGAVRANLFTGSAIFRHALRLAICVPVADAAGRAIDWQRSYWIPMTVAIVLKPDFITTFSRGALRLSGTLVGLALATVLYHLLPESPLRQLVLVGAFMFLMRKIGPANYGVYSIAVSGLVVFLLAAAGTSPRDTVIARGSDTLTGGVAALIAYVLWPTWERKRVFHPIADLIDATRDYFHAVREGLSGEGNPDGAALDEKRRLWR